jgi:hypothetical protein
VTDVAVYLGPTPRRLALGLWKCNQMGILPTGSADFLAFETRGEVRSRLGSLCWVLRDS